jgi:hypothetical protein
VRFDQIATDVRMLVSMHTIPATGVKLERFAELVTPLGTPVPPAAFTAQQDADDDEDDDDAE